MKVLVVGGAGYLGHQCVYSLIHTGHDVTVYDSLLYTDEYDVADVAFVRGDITENDRRLETCLKTADAVVWLAAIVGDAACMIDPDRAIRVNLDSVARLAEMYDGPIVFTSSCSVYGINEGIADEETLTSPLSLYAETKLKAEAILANKNAAILRLGTLHGASHRMRFDLVVNAMTRDAVMKHKIDIFGGQQFRPVTHVSDVATLINVLIWGGWEPGVYNVAAQNLTIRDIARKVEECIPDAEIHRHVSDFEDKRNYAVSSKKLLKSLETAHGYKRFIFRNIVENSVVDIAEMLESQRLKNPYHPRYSNLLTLQGGV